MLRLERCFLSPATLIWVPKWYESCSECQCYEIYRVLWRVGILYHAYYIQYYICTVVRAQAVYLKWKRGVPPNSCAYTIIASVSCWKTRVTLLCVDLCMRQPCKLFRVPPNCQEKKKSELQSSETSVFSQFSETSVFFSSWIISDSCRCFIFLAGMSWCVNPCDIKVVFSSEISVLQTPNTDMIARGGVEEGEGWCIQCPKKVEIVAFHCQRMVCCFFPPVTEI